MSWSISCKYLTWSKSKYKVENKKTNEQIILEESGQYEVATAKMTFDTSDLISYQSSMLGDKSPQDEIILTMGSWIMNLEVV